MKNFLLAVVFLVSGALHAGKEEEAILHYEKGEKLYGEGKYEAALAEFRKAYSRQPVAALFINIGQCFRQMGQHSLAIQSFERYLVDEPDGEQRAAVEELLADERKAAAPPPPEPEPPPPEVAPTPAAAPVPEAPPPPSDESIFDGPVVWAALGATALLVAGGAVAAVVLTLPPPPAPQPAGSLGNYDLR